MKIIKKKCKRCGRMVSKCIECGHVFEKQSICFMFPVENTGPKLEFKHFCSIDCLMNWLRKMGFVGVNKI